MKRYFYSSCILLMLETEMNQSFSSPFGPPCSSPSSSPFACSDSELNVSPLSNNDMFRLRESTVGGIDNMRNVFVSKMDIRADTSIVPEDVIARNSSTPKNVTLSGIDIYSLSILGEFANAEKIVFRNCTFHVSDFGRIFEKCPALKVIQFINCAMDEVKTFSRLFDKVNYLEAVEFRNCTTSSLENMEYVFCDCGYLDSSRCVIEIDTSKVKTAEGMFYDCFSITSLNMCRSFVTSELRNMKKFCYGCKSLYDISGIADLNVKNVETMAEMFRYCRSLRGVLALHKWETLSLQNLNKFLALSGVYCVAGLRDWFVKSVRDTECIFWRSDLTTTTGMEKWYMPLVTSLSAVFACCDKLVDLSGIQDLDVKNVKDLTRTFEGTAITNLECLRKWATDNVELMNYTFTNCQNLVNIDGIEDWNVQRLKDTIAMFESTPITDTYAFRKWRTLSLQRTIRMFCNCVCLVDVEGVSHIIMSKVVDTSCMFMCCIMLVDVSPLRRWNFDRWVIADYMYCDTGINSTNGLENHNMGTLESLRRYLAGTQVTTIQGFNQVLKEDADARGICSGCPLTHALKDAPLLSRLRKWYQ